MNKTSPQKQDDARTSQQTSNESDRGQRSGAGGSASSSSQATDKSKKGEPLSANKQSERSPKQENL